jgi:diguanylate cyclase (GGDEF)-like protein/PAS domain S-box-containing protein
MIVLGDLETTRRYVSPACRDLLGFEPYELIGTRPVDGVHPDDAGAYRAILERLTSGKDERITSCQRYRRKDGSWVWTEVTFRLVRDSSGRPTAYVASVRDITSRHMLEEQLREQARTDVLTGLSNRRALEERLEEEWRRAQRTGAPLALLCLDIDFFKQFNDHFGHAAGDECLKQVAEIIRQERRASDFAARLGGEEFVLILPETTAEGAVAVAEVIRNKLSAAPIAHPRSRYAVVTASIGVAASSPVDLGDATNLLKAADMAMYQAKRSGRNRVVLAAQARSATGGPLPTILVA